MSKPIAKAASRVLATASAATPARSAASARWCREFERSCRERGIRVTPQRLAVYRALAQDTSHPTVDALHARLAPTLPSLSLATVYRILESLEREGLIRRASTKDGAARFDANLEPHQHLACTVCGRLSDFEDPGLSRLRLPRVAPRTFVPHALDIRIVGICRTCLDATQPKTVTPKTTRRT